jgi:hypothetical protein
MQEIDENMIRAEKSIVGRESGEEERGEGGGLGRGNGISLPNTIHKDVVTSSTVASRSGICV